MNQKQNLRDWAAVQWACPPAPFNPEARPGLSDAVSREYAKWCECNQGSTKAERIEAYRAIYIKLKPDYPSYEEMVTHARSQ